MVDTMEEVRYISDQFSYSVSHFGIMQFNDACNEVLRRNNYINSMLIIFTIIIEPKA